MVVDQPSPAQPSSNSPSFSLFPAAPGEQSQPFIFFFFFEKSFQNCLDYVLFITVQIHEVLMK